MAGLVPAIHAVRPGRTSAGSRKRLGVDARHKAGHDGLMAAVPFLNAHPAVLGETAKMFRASENHPPLCHPRAAACSSRVRRASWDLATAEAMITARATTPIRMVQMALISGVTPSRTWE